MEAADQLQTNRTTAADVRADANIQSCGFLLELSLDWIVLRASENIHELLGESHVTLIDEPLGRFVHAQALHDLRNLFSRLSGTTGIARAYGVRLTDDPDLVDVAFQLSDGRVLFEAVPSARTFGERFGTVGGLIAGLAGSSGQALLDNAARRMRALTGYDRVTLVCGEQRAESSRGAFAAAAIDDGDLPVILSDAGGDPVALFPRNADESSSCNALMRASRLLACEICTFDAIWLCGCVLLFAIASSAAGTALLLALTTISEQRCRKSVCCEEIGVGDVASAGQATSIAWPTAA